MINDIIKYIILRNLTFNVFDETTILQMIFAYRYSQYELINTVLKELNLSSMKFDPQYTFNTASNDILIRLSENSKTGLKLPIIGKYFNCLE